MNKIFIGGEIIVLSLLVGVISGVIIKRRESKKIDKMTDYIVKECMKNFDDDVAESFQKEN